MGWLVVLEGLDVLESGRQPLSALVQLAVEGAHDEVGGGWRNSGSGGWGNSGSGGGFWKDGDNC